MMALTGNELLLVEVSPAGPFSYRSVPVSEVRGAAQGYQVLAVQSGVVSAGPETSTYYFTAPLTGSVIVQAPAVPIDAQLVVIVNASGATFTQGISFNAAAGQSVRNGSLASLQ